MVIDKAQELEPLLVSMPLLAENRYDQDMELHEQADAVHDADTLLEFVGALVADREDELAGESQSPSSRHSPDTNGWENGTIEGFLGAASAWAESTNFGKTQGLLDTNPWRQFAVFLYCGKIYE